MDNVIVLFNHPAYSRTVAIVKVLDIPAKYIGSDDFADYWLGTDGQLYGTY